MSRSTVIGVAAAAAMVFFASVAGCPAVPGTGGTGTGSFNIAPTPVITADVTRGVLPLTVQFGSDRSTDDGLIVSREWNFGDGTTSRDVSPRHSFLSTGNFTVRLTLTDDDGAQSSRTTTIVVTQAPVPVITADQTIFENAPAIVNFSSAGSFDPDGTIREFRWDFGDGSREFLQNVQHQYATSGTYRATLTVTDNAGVTAVAEVFIQVGIAQPTIELRVPPPDISNVVVSTDSPLWIQAVFTSDPSAPRFIRAGIDGDRDECEAQAAVIAPGTGAVSTRLTGHLDRVTGAVFSPDGTRVLTSSEDGTLRLVSATTGALISEYTAVGDATCVAFNTEGTRFAYGESGGNVVLRETANGAIIRTFAGHAGRVNAVAVSPNGAQILSAGSDRRALLWNVADGTILRDFGSTLAVNAVAFNPADATIVATGGEDALIRLWNVTGGENIGTLTGHTGAVNAVAFSPDGTRLFSGGDDDMVRVWTVNPVANIAVLNAHKADVLSVTLDAAGALLATGDADGVVKVWNPSTGAVLATSEPCVSAITSLDFSPDATRVLAGIGARNQIQLDTSPPNGNDLNLTYPVALSMAGKAIEPGEYFLWAEIDTDRTEPTRSYAAATVSVVAPFTSDISTDTPVIPLVNDRASVILPDAKLTPVDTRRAVFDLGVLSRGDRVVLSFLSTPGFGDFYTAPGKNYSLMVTDENRNVFAWYQPDFVAFSRDARLVIGHNSGHYYVIMDGGFGVNVRIERAAGFDTRTQRVYVRFDGSGNSAVKIGTADALVVPALQATSINPAWGPAETTIIKNTVMTTLAAKFAGFNVEFTSSDNPPPAAPYLTLWVGGSNFSLYGVADYIDPRNDTVTGNGIVYAVTLGQTGLGGAFTNPVTSAADVGSIIGTVGAHEVGHLLGLRHTQGVALDIMAPGVDPTLPVAFSVAEVNAGEQAFVVPGAPRLPVIGIQDALTHLAETVGP